MRFLFSLMLFCLAITACQTNPIPDDPKKFLVAIQPLETVDDETISLMSAAITEAYGFRVVVLNKIPMPAHSFINVKSPRYRADSIIRFLRASKPDSIGIIIGVTHKDISTTKKDKNGMIKKPEYKYSDFGIFGLGFRPGVSCVVSTFRLGNKKLKAERVKKISLHEVGHNLGLPHCSDKNCLMTDAAESIKTIDNAASELCGDCKRTLGLNRSNNNKSQL